ncbi:MAG: LAGLIDADG family homing endonuclease, partial [Bacteroidota bacterium]
MDVSPDWIVGFVDGEGCFYVGINEHPEMKVGYQVLPEFRVVQHEKDIQVLHALKRFFRCGVVRRNHDDRFELRIRKIECLLNVVQFFEKHPLKTKKNADFKKFARVVRWMEQEKHLSKDGLIDIIETASTMNRSDKPIAS